VNKMYPHPTIKETMLSEGKMPHLRYIYIKNVKWNGRSYWGANHYKKRVKRHETYPWGGVEMVFKLQYTK
jgi:hypothetical protein